MCKQKLGSGFGVGGEVEPIYKAKGKKKNPFWRKLQRQQRLAAVFLYVRTSPECSIMKIYVQRL